MSLRNKTLKILTFTVLLALYVLVGNFEGARAETDDLIKINESSFPDEVFRNYVSSKYDRDKDGYASKEALSKAEWLNLRDMGISSLKGIEYFTGINKLVCGDNSITELDLSQNRMLRSLECPYNQINCLVLCPDAPLELIDCRYNELTSLDISGLSMLKRLECRFNSIEQIDLKDNKRLLYLNLAGNKLTKLDISENTWLVWLYAQWNEISELSLGDNKNLSYIEMAENKLSEINVSSVPKLTYLRVYKNNLNSLYIRNNPFLTELDCLGNNLTELDISENDHLSVLRCAENWITEIDLSNLSALTELYIQDNKLTSLDISGNSALMYINCQNNPLSELDISQNIYLESSDIRIKKTAIIIDNFAPLELNAVNFPDDSLRNAISDISGDTDGMLDRKEIKKLVLLELADKNIEDMTGIGLLPGVKKLNISNNMISKIDLGSNICLSELICTNCGLNSLDVSACVGIKKIACNKNNISELILSQNRNLDWLDCSNNKIKTLDINKCPKLVALYKNNYCENGTLSGISYSEYSFPGWNEDPLKLLKYSAGTLKYLPDPGLSETISDEDYIFAILKQPGILVVDKDETGIMSIEAVGDMLNYTWKCSRDYGSTYIELKTGSESFVEIPYEDIGDDSYMIYCVVKDYYGRTLSSHITDVLFNTEGGVVLNKKNFPDENFRKLVEKASYSSYIIYPDSLEKLTDLTVNDENITSIKGIELLKNLKRVTISAANIEAIGLGNLPITNLAIYDCNLKELDLRDNAALTRLVIKGGSLEKFTLGNDPSIKSILLNNSSITSLNLSDAQFLEKIDIYDNPKLETIKLGTNPCLKLINGENNGFEELDLSKCRALSEVTLSGNKNLGTVCLPESESLKKLELSDSNLTSVDISRYSNLTSLDLSHNRLSELNVSSCPLLESLSLSYNRFRELDVSKNEQLGELMCDHNELYSLTLHEGYRGYNTLLRKIWCNSNRLKVLNIAGIEALLELKCYDNDIKYLYMGGGFVSRYAGNVYSYEMFGYMYKITLLTDDENGCEYEKHEFLINDKDWVYLYKDTDTITSVDENDWLWFESEPDDIIINVGEKAVFEATAKGQDINYRWIYTVPGDSEWHYIGDMTSEKVEFEYDESLNGAQVWCRIYDAYGQEKDSRKASITYKLNGENTDILYGDADGDGVINAKDVTVLRRYLVGGWNVTVDLANADVDGDGTINVKDVMILRRFLAGGWDVLFGKQ